MKRINDLINFAKKVCGALKKCQKKESEFKTIKIMRVKNHVKEDKTTFSFSS